MLKKLTLKIILSLIMLILLSCGRDEIDPQKVLESLRTETKPNMIKELFFVGKYGDRVGVYKYDFENKKNEIFWGTFRETVLKLSYDEAHGHLFFLTARSVGTRRGVSSIRNLKLYRIDLAKLTTELISEIGNVVQVYANWSEKRYKIQFTKFDLKYSSLIDKYTQVYSQFGKLLREEKESFNFISGSYPSFDLKHNSLISPSGNFGVKQMRNEIYLNVSGSNESIFIDSSGSKIDKVGWSDEERYVFIRVKNELTANESATIYIFDIIYKNVMQKFSSESVMNFIVTKDLLIFDRITGGVSLIELFNFRKNEKVETIKLRGNCGLQYISDF
jgi:hypothetical protein